MALAVAGLVGIGGPPAGATVGHSITVGPSTSLSDGDTVTIWGSGFVETPLINDWAVAMCSRDIITDGILVVNALKDCDTTTEPFTFVHADANGDFTTQFKVRKTFSTGGGPVTCGQAPDDCAILVSQLTGPDLTGSAVPISFTVHTLTVTPSTGLSDGQTVTVNGAGYFETPIADWALTMCSPEIVAQPLSIQNAVRVCAVGTEPFTFVPPDNSGNLSAQLTVRKTLSTLNGPVTCGQAPNDCYVLLAQLTGPFGFQGAAVPISFGKPVPTLADCIRTFLNDHQHRLRVKLFRLLVCIWTAVTHRPH